MTSIGPYDIESEIGRGAMGRVLKARHRTTGVIRAVKVVLESTGPSAHIRFQKEAELIARAGGDGIVTVHEAGVHQGALWYAMDYCERGSLGALLARRRIPWREAAVLVAKVARAVSRCHQVGVVHRDVKPENILLDERGEPRLSDFGCARDLLGDRLTKTGATVGTALYMSPEQLRGEPADERADVYALGALLYECIAGAVPYDAPTWVDLLAQAEKGGFARVRTLDPEAPAALDDALARALAPKAADRTPSALLLASELDVVAGAPTRAPVRVERAGRVGLLVLAARVLLAGAGFVAWRQLGGGAAAKPEAALSVTILEPTTAAPVLDDAPVSVSGRVEGPCRDVWVNGVRATLTPDGRFSAVVALAADAREIVAVAHGREGNVEARRPIVRRATMPAWLRALPRDRRPRTPLPVGMHASENEGEYVHEKDGSVLVFVPGGRCPIGTDTGDTYERPARQADVGPFFIGKYEVTVEQYAAFVATTGHKTIAEVEGVGITLELGPEREGLKRKTGVSWRDPEGDAAAIDSRQPATQLAYADALAYVRWAGLALPTEEQWEKAASWDGPKRTKRRYSWGDERPSGGSPALANLRDAALVRAHGLAGEDFEDGFARSAPVGSLPRDCSPYGALDMMGNVAEWCHHPGAEEVSRESLVFMRGGSWLANKHWVRATQRLRAPAETRTSSLGLRVALEVSER